jgi:TRIAD3 protein (E3 ubiquitin-protein ligase RNF216)
VECQCCYDTVPVTQTVTCAARAAHTVCEGCVRHLVQARIGEGSAKPLTCLAGGAGCKAPLPHKAVAQALASPVRRQRDAIVARAELMRANIEGLQSCPFCPYSCVKPALFTDAPEVFQCEHPTCGKRSCTRCKGEVFPDKPHACPEAPETDALTDAVIRDCPRCATRFYKDAGCNKMRCPTCAAESCYVCRKLITDKVPYLHFCFCDCNVSRRGHITRRGATARERCRLCGKCSLWHADAAQPALEDTRKRSCACVVS